MEENEEHPGVLIEDWFPFKKVGVECRRERAMSSALPPLNYLHVYWARRPLSVSKASILGAVLPLDFERKKYSKLMKFSKNLVQNYEKIQLYKKLNKKERVGYDGPRAFTQNLTIEEKKEIHNLITSFWGKEKLKILDPMAGGGAIPFEAARLGFQTYSSDLNPLPYIIQKANIDFPSKLGQNFSKIIQKYGKVILKNCDDYLKQFYPPNVGQKINDGYLWLKTIPCPNNKCNLSIPLSPNWWLSKPKDTSAALKIHYDNDLNNLECTFSIIKNPKQNNYNPNNGTYSRGNGICPRCNMSFSTEYIRDLSKRSLLTHRLVAVVEYEKIGRKKIVSFRIPNKNDLESLKKVDIEIEKKIIQWKKEGLYIDDEIFEGYSTNTLLNLGIKYWRELFNSRQYLANGFFFEQIINLKKELLEKKSLNSLEIQAIITYLQFALNKILNYNSVLSIWFPLRNVIVNSFNQHAFIVKTSYCEMETLRKGFNWAINSIIDCYNDLHKLIENQDIDITINQNSADNLKFLHDKEIDCVVVDPPYYNNVMYAELSDFFYVWIKRSLGDLFPNIFKQAIVNKDLEAVSNPSRFENMGKSKKLLAKQDYETKMNLIFKEISRVLQDQGVLVIMFTHKETDAWDTLTMALMDAGFDIRASWPVHTESETSLHIAKKNAVKNTILLVCRKRTDFIEELWWEDDVLPAIRKIVTQKAKEFRKLGIEGVDLVVSCFGPALKEFSKSYPVKNIAGDVVRAEEAIEAARKVVIDITLQEIIKGKSYNIDPCSKFYLTAWYFFKARSFPFDEARRLALSIGINIDELKTSYKILKKNGGDVLLVLPKDREKNGSINVDNPKDNGILIDAVHIAMLAYEEGGQKLFENVVEKLRRNTDKSFRLYMETLFNILPDVKDLANNLPEKKILGEILMTTKEKITPEGGKITDFLDQ